MIDFSSDFSKEKKTVRIFSIVEGVGLILSLILLLLAVPHGWIMMTSFLMVGTAFVVLILFRRSYNDQPIVRQKQPYLGEYAQVRAQIGKYENTLVNEAKSRDQIQQDEKRAVEKRQSEYQSALATYRSQHDQVDQSERNEIIGILKKMQLDYFNRGMQAHLITDASISGVGPKMKEKLAAHGIHTAADVSPTRIQSVPGFGEAKSQAVVAWRQDIERKLQREAPKNVPDHVAKQVHEKYEQQHHQIASQERAANEKLPKDLANIAAQALAKQEEYSRDVVEANKCLPPLKERASTLGNILEQYRSITFFAYIRRALGSGGPSMSLHQQLGAYALGAFLVLASLCQFASGGLSSVMAVVDTIPTVTQTLTPTITPTTTLTPTITPSPTETSTPIPTWTSTPTLTPTVTLTPTITQTPTRTLAPTRTVAPTQTRWPTATNAPVRSGGTNGGSSSGGSGSGGSTGGPTALCRDGTYSYSQHRQGTCSHHGGVAQWLANLP